MAGPLGRRRGPRAVGSLLMVLGVVLVVMLVFRELKGEEYTVHFF